MNPKLERGVDSNGRGMAEDVGRRSAAFPRGIVAGARLSSRMTFRSALRFVALAIGVGGCTTVASPRPSPSPGVEASRPGSSPSPPSSPEDSTSAASPSGEPSAEEGARPTPSEPAGPQPDVFVPLEALGTTQPRAIHLATAFDPELRARIAGLIETPPFDQMRWGIVAKDLHDGEVLFSLNSREKFTPASNMKVLASAAALSGLGPDYRFQTGVYATGSARRGGIDGALVVVGVGDPTLSDRFHASWRTPLEALADSLRDAGIRNVSGPLVIDVSAWDSTSVPGSRMVEDVGWSWGASGGAFAVQGGEVVLQVRAPARLDGQATVTADPRLPSGRLAIDIRSADTDSAVVDSRPAGEGGLVVSGSVPPSWRRTLRIAQGDPVRVAGELLYDVLTSRGMVFEGGLVFAWEPNAALPGGCASGRVADCPSARRVATLTSPPLRDILDRILGASDNWVTDQVVRAMAQRLEGRGGWSEASDAIKAELARSYSVLSKDVEVVDASGLSPYNLLTPRSLVDVLTQIRIGPHGDRFRGALAEPRKVGTTLEGRLRSLEGRIYAKTGSLRHVNSLSGYLVRDNGREMVFSILTNSSGLEAREVRRRIDALVLELSRW